MSAIHPCLTAPGARHPHNHCHYDLAMVCECGLTKLEIDLWGRMTGPQREIAVQRAAERRASKVHGTNSIEGKP